MNQPTISVLLQTLASLSEQREATISGISALFFIALSYSAWRMFKSKLEENNKQ